MLSKAVVFNLPPKILTCSSARNMALICKSPVGEVMGKWMGIFPVFHICSSQLACAAVMSSCLFFPSKSIEKKEIVQRHDNSMHWVLKAGGEGQGMLARQTSIFWQVRALQWRRSTENWRARPKQSYQSWVFLWFNLMYHLWLLFEWCTP